MSLYGNRGRGRGGRVGNQRPGLLGTAPPPLLETPYKSPSYKDTRSKVGLLGSAPKDYNQRSSHYEEKPYPQSQENEYCYPEQPDYDDQDYDNEQGQGYIDHRSQTSSAGGYSEPPKRLSPIERLPPNVRHIMSNLGLTKADMNELSRLPEKDLSSSNVIQIIKNIRDRKNHQQQPQPDHPRRSFSRERSSDNLYDPSHPTGSFDDTDQYEEQRYTAEERRTDAFSSFQEKWYSDTTKKNDRDSQSGSSILRGSRGAVAKPIHWDRDDHPSPPKQTRRSPPLRRSPQLRRPSPVQRRAPSPLPIRRPSPPPMRRRSPPRQQSPPPRRMTPPPRPRRMSPPPRMSSPPRNIRPQQNSRGSLLGDPHKPSGQGLVMLANSVADNRQNTFRPNQGFREPENFRKPRALTPPPLMPEHRSAVPRPDPMLQAQIKAMEVLQTEATHKNRPPHIQERRGQGGAIAAVSKEEAVAEAGQMRREEGRVLYLRYQAGAMGLIREEHLVKLAQPFEKVTNILFVAPKHSKSGWYQAFVELGHFDGAAAMCEHYMCRPPVVEGITIQVQRSKYQNLQLRQDQMNRDFDRYLPNYKEGKRRRVSLSPDRSRKGQNNSKGRRGEKRSLSPKVNKKTDEKSKKPRSSPSSKDVKKPTKETKTQIKKEKEIKAEPVDTVSEAVSEGSKDKEVEKKDDSKGESDTKELNGGKVLDLKAEKNFERIQIIEENLEQATTLSESLLKKETEEGNKDIINEILEYLGDSMEQIKELKAS